MTQLVYAGIGSRATPPETLRDMTIMAAWLARRGWHLHSGGAAGADSAFAAGAPGRAPHRVPALARISRLRRAGLPHPLARAHAHLPRHRRRPASHVATAARPPPGLCMPETPRSCWARTADTTPVHAVVAWTERGLISGGTGQGIRIARRYDIPVLNLGSMTPRAVCERLEEIRAAASPGARPA